jgi:hypothetical protein
LAFTIGITVNISVILVLRNGISNSGVVDRNKQERVLAAQSESHNRSWIIAGDDCLAPCDARWRVDNDSAWTWGFGLGVGNSVDIGFVAQTVGTVLGEQISRVEEMGISLTCKCFH